MGSRRNGRNGFHPQVVLMVMGLLPVSLQMTGCASGVLQGLLPPVYDYKSYLVPTHGSGGESAYEVNEDGSITFDQDGVRVTVTYLSDEELNRRYSGVSYQDRFSANPFTYGNWRDPSLGYTPNRFTVFEVEVFNPVLPKVEMFPDHSVLRTNLGEHLTFYGINREDSKNSFEVYYTLIRGPGGNEQYRFDQRMGIIREELYRGDQQVFKGQDYSGYLVYQSLDSEVTSVELQLGEFALQFDEANNPSRKSDLVFHFERHIEKRQLQGDEAVAARQRAWVLPGGAAR